jgi:hypothetical protein
MQELTSLNIVLRTVKRATSPTIIVLTTAKLRVLVKIVEVSKEERGSAGESY